MAARLGITTRHLRREQAASLRALADYLNLQFDLSDESHLVESITRRAKTTSQSSVDINREMLWLADSLRDQTSEIEPVLRKALDLAQVLARQRSVELCLSCASAISPAAIPPIVLSLCDFQIWEKDMANAQQPSEAEAKIQCVLDMLDQDESDRLVGGDNAEFRAVCEAVLAWQELLFTALGLKEDDRTRRLLASSMVVLGTIVQHAYALGVRRGRTQTA